MKEPRIFSLQEEVRREAEHIKKELEEDPTLDDIVVTEEMDAALLELIHAYDREEEELDKRAAEFSEELAIGKEEILAAREKIAAADGNKTIGAEGDKITAAEKDETIVEEDNTRIVRFRSRKIRKHAMVSVAALAVLVMALGMTSVGSKSCLKVIREKITGDNRVKIINGTDTDRVESVDETESEILVILGKKMGVDIPEFLYKPYGMRVTGYETEEELKKVKIFYEYQKRSIEYLIYSSDKDASFGIEIEDNQVGEYFVIVDDVEIKVEEFDVPEEDENRFVASFMHQDTYYELKGIMEKEEFIKMVENLYFV
ncbi:MAG: DUF4367 domain-containing protein [Schaedlerella sp.]|nr:DUF4367 domain-containing protein [Lachnospiraceae bacterium]MDY4202208.1 DUF4367 domain-containing protein [Schaedlerella sp.]